MCDALIALMQRESLDFIQVDYSIGNRSAGERVLPLAADRGMAVPLNVPIGVNVPIGGARGNAIANEWLGPDLPSSRALALSQPCRPGLVALP